MATGYPKGDGHRPTVFSCFAGVGGSTMGYKLAGYDVVGCCELDDKARASYIRNHHPRVVLTDVCAMARGDFPNELRGIDVLDGSPPCSTFSLAGNREGDWGKSRKFREGQANQILDELYFHFIETARRMRPRVVVSENVMGLQIGAARQYLERIKEHLRSAGYFPIITSLYGPNVGLPQARTRLFLIALNMELIHQVPIGLDGSPRLDHDYPLQKEIPFGEIVDASDRSERAHGEGYKYWLKTPPGQGFASIHPRAMYFNHTKTSLTQVVPTIPASRSHWYHETYRYMNAKEITLATSFPSDFDFTSVDPTYSMGMSVPPIMMATIADMIKRQWLDRIPEGVCIMKQSPERVLIHALRKSGRVNVYAGATLPGQPDMLVENTAVFVDGCYWHGCPEHHQKPFGNVAFWDAKLEQNRIRDAAADAELEALGYEVIRIWEHELKTAEAIQAVAERLVRDAR